MLMHIFLTGMYQPIIKFIKCHNARRYSLTNKRPDGVCVLLNPEQSKHSNNNIMNMSSQTFYTTSSI